MHSTVVFSINSGLLSMGTLLWQHCGLISINSVYKLHISFRTLYWFRKKIDLCCFVPILLYFLFLVWKWFISLLINIFSNVVYTVINITFYTDSQWNSKSSIHLFKLESDISAIIGKQNNYGTLHRALFCKTFHSAYLPRLFHSLWILHPLFGIFSLSWCPGNTSSFLQLLHMSM